MDTAMYEIKTKQNRVLNLHLEYCGQCDEYKGYSQNFKSGQEKEALQEKLNQIYKTLDEIVDYKLVIPLNDS
jgi:hypothetical protein